LAIFLFPVLRLELGYTFVVYFLGFHAALELERLKGGHFQLLHENFSLQVSIQLYPN
jgi:hypothetical protein